MEYYIIDRFEGNFAVCQNLQNEKMQNIQKNLLPKNVKESDVIFFEDNKYFFDEEKTLERKKIIEDKFNSLWN